MGLRDKYAKRDAEQRFEPMELNETNVQAVFNRCKANENWPPEWNEEALKKNRANIRYLLGQLALVHEGVQEHELDSAFVKRYDGKSWTGSSNLVWALIGMGINGDCCSLTKRDEQLFICLHAKLRTTLSPKDPKFAAWWEGADGLMIQAEAAEDEHKLDEMFSSCEKEAKLGKAAAQFSYGWMYNNGKGTAKDKAKALYWYEKAAEQGHAEAQYKCGFMYKYGEGTAEDDKKALYWYEKAAEQGLAKAQSSCGSMYDDGEGTAKDKAKALYWYEKAAEQGSANAQFICGCMYYNGEGTAKDRAKAKLWLQKAAAQTEDKEMQKWAKEFLEKYF